MHLFYQPDIQTHPFLTEEESRHAVKVLRLSSGARVGVIDGKGSFVVAEIIKPHEKKCEFRIISTTKAFGKRDFYLHLVVAPTKNLDRMEWMVEKCTEIGVDEISFVLCRYSERKDLKIERLEKIAVAAMKQSQKAYLPQINALQPFRKVIDLVEQSEKFVAHLEKGERFLLQNATIPKTSCCILIGPEGDFSSEEINLAMQKGFKSVSLGTSRLRTETAVIVACHTVNLINE